MRKVVVEIIPDEKILQMIEPVMKHIEEIEMVELLRLDMHRGIKIGVVRFKLQPGGNLRDIASTGLFEIIEMIEEKKDETLCLIKMKAPPGFESLREKADLDLKMVPPMKISRERIIYTFVGEDEQIAKMIELLKEIGESYRLSVHQAVFEKNDILSVLTDRQRELMILAKDMGYYQYPRKVGAADLAEAVGISASTVIEHLRKTENRLMDEILAGQR